MALHPDLEMRAETARNAMYGLLQLVVNSKYDIEPRQFADLLELVFRQADSAMPKNRPDHHNDEPAI